MRTRLLIPALVMLAVPLVPASAQTPAQPTPPAPTEQSQNIPDQKLDAAAAAVKKVAELKQDFEQKIAASPEGDRRKIAEEANTALTKAVTDQGLTVEEYSSILTVAQNDPQIREKILQRLRPPQ